MSDKTNTMGSSRD